MTLQAILVDIDGTLLDSNEAHARTWVDVLTSHGHDAPYELVRPLIGKGGDKLLEELVGFDDTTDEGRRMVAEQLELMVTTKIMALPPTPGARELLQRLKTDGYRIVVATSSSREQLAKLLKQAGVDDLIDAASSSSDADASKPDPDIIMAAIDKAGVRADECVMIGDTPFDIVAASKAGVPTIALRCGGWWNDGDLGDAIEIYDDPAALLSGLASSRLGRERPQGT